MTIYASLLPPSDHPNDVHSPGGHFSFTYHIQVDFQSPDAKITDHFLSANPPRSTPSSFPAGPLHDLHRRPDPSSPSWTAVEKLLYSMKRYLALKEHTIQWRPISLVQNPNWTQLDNEEDLIRHVLDDARGAVAGKKPSSLCVKIKRVVKVSEDKLKGIKTGRWIRKKMKPFSSDNGMYRVYKGLFSEDVGAARRVWRLLCRAMARDFGVALPGMKGLRSEFVSARVWEREERVMERGEEEEEELCSICLVGDGGKCRLPCVHTYHPKCIRRWMKKKRNCPLCRRRL